MKRDFHPAPLHEAMPLLRWFFFLAVVAAIGRWWEFSMVCLLGFLFHAAFHRNPSRKTPNDPSLWMSPAYGKVTDIVEVDEPKFIKGKACRIGIFLSIFDVHTQPSPCDATLKWIDYQPGKFWDARDPHASFQNESQMLGLETPDGMRFMVKQISGWIARRIILWRLLHEEVSCGELLGMIRYGSRVELYVPVDSTKILVQVGNRVRGGSTPVAQRIIHRKIA